MSIGNLIILSVICIIAYFYFKSKKKQAQIDFNIFPPVFIVFDLETTGLNAEKNEIIEIGALKVTANKQGDSSDIIATPFQSLVKPSKKLPKKIIEITGITDDLLEKEGRKAEEVILEFLDFIEDYPLVTFNAEFDMAFFNHAVKKYYPNKSIKNEVHCALKMARKAWPGQKSYKLSNLSKQMGLDTDDEHRALGDAKRALAVFIHTHKKLNAK